MMPAAQAKPVTSQDVAAEFERLAESPETATAAYTQTRVAKDWVDLNIGPQHPSTHGVLRLRVRLTGEYVDSVEPVLGYLHRSKEKIAELGQYIKFLPITDRMDYLAGMANNHGFVLAVERLANIQIPERAEYIRVIAVELNRIASHLLWLGTFGLDLGAITPFFYCFRDREKILELLEMLSGARLTYSYMRFGGVRFDMPENFTERVLATVDDLESRWKELDSLLTENDIVKARLKGIGVLPLDRCISYGVTGPALRAAGMKFDIRKDDPYSVYPKLNFDIPTGTINDCYGRYRVRMEEYRQSIRILRQACKQTPEGPWIAEGFEAGKILRVKPPNGEVYARVEAPRGELGFYIVSEGGLNPYRLHIRPHSYHNLQPLNEMCKGLKIPDLIVTLGSIDIVLGDIDR